MRLCARLLRVLSYVLAPGAAAYVTLVYLSLFGKPDELNSTAGWWCAGTVALAAVGGFTLFVACQAAALILKALATKDDGSGT